ncbi:MAG: cache domain-containing protein [bacterium]|nr:cache domain-containing protein [bacterium]
MSKARPKRGLMFQLILLLLLIALIPLVISNSNLVKLNENYLENNLLDNHAERARGTAQEISSYLRNAIEKLEIITRLQPLTQTFSDVQKYQLLFFFLEEYKDFVSIALMDKNGAVASEIVRPAVNSMHVSERAKRRESVFQQAVGGELSIADPMSLPQEEMALVTIGLPIYFGDQVNGVLVAEMSMQRIWEIVNNIATHRSGEAYLVDRRGRLIAHRDRGRVMAQEDMTAEEIVGTYLAVGNTGGALPFVNRNGQEMLGAYAPLNLEGWGVVVQQPKKDAYFVVAEMKFRSLLWGGFTGILVCLIGVFFARKISVPIMNFTQSALRIAKGNFKERVSLKSGNEIGQLADTFNYMAQELDLHDQNMRDLFMSAISSLAAAIDARDPYTRGHSERVTAYSLAIADEMAVEPAEREVVHLAGLLHDVGKIGIDDSVLRKPNQLTDEEFRIIKQHPEKGANIMSPIKQLKGVIPSMRHHHERYDGNGYPDGIGGEAIPLPARIITIADTFDAMTSDRPYQMGVPDEEVVEKIAGWAGSRYDPAVCEAFARAHRKGKIRGIKGALEDEECGHEALTCQVPHLVQWPQGS